MEKPPADRPPAPVERDDVRVAAHRCPYCRDDVASTEGVVCRECLTRHHPGCWDEAGRCSSCGSGVRLEVPSATRAAGSPRSGPACALPRCEEPARWEGNRLRLGPRPFPLCDRHGHAVRFRAILGGGFVGVCLTGASWAEAYGAVVDHDSVLGGMALLTAVFAALGFVVAFHAWRRGLRRLD
ncbi:MAG: hypothetical protein KDD82_20480 [Planctomycetes bacterium]|nr:hypothetical protein [Planctomycetota bacterium]